MISTKTELLNAEEVAEARQNYQRDVAAGEYDMFDNDDFADAEEREALAVPDLKYRKIHTYLGDEGGPIDRIICDEGHYVKNSRTKCAAGIEQIRPLFKWFVSATPMLNRVADYRGYLYQLWQPSWEVVADDVKGEQMYEEGFNPEKCCADKDLDLDAAEQPIMSILPADAQLDVHKMWVGNGVWLPVLDYELFHRTGSANEWDIATVTKMLKAIIPLVQLRRTIDSVVDFEDGTSQRVGRDILPYKVRTIDLKYPLAQQKVYNSLTDQATKKLDHSDQATKKLDHSDPGNQTLENTAARPEGIINFGALREVQHAIYDLDLPKMMKSLGRRYRRGVEGRAGRSGEVNRWYGKDGDNGVTYRWKAIRPYPYLPVYQDRISQAAVMTANSPKTALTLRYLAKWVCEEKEKVIIMTQYPACQW